MKNNYKLVLFDLDGTLIDTSPGIFNSVKYAEKKMQLTPVDENTLRSFIGPPPVSSYKRVYGLNDEDAQKATGYHRNYGLKYGAYEAKVYDGIPQLLTDLKCNHMKLAVCTLKRQDIAEKVLTHFNLYNYFDIIVGIDESESLTKADTINIALNELGIKDPKQAIMIGDSVYDAEGAACIGVPFVGVLYGFGLSKYEKYEFTVCKNVEELKGCFI